MQYTLFQVTGVLTLNKMYIKVNEIKSTKLRCQLTNMNRTRLSFCRNFLEKVYLVSTFGKLNQCRVKASVKIIRLCFCIFLYNAIAVVFHCKYHSYSPKTHRQHLKMTSNSCSTESYLSQNVEHIKVLESRTVHQSHGYS